MKLIKPVIVSLSALAVMVSLSLAHADDPAKKGGKPTPAAPAKPAPPAAHAAPAGGAHPAAPPAQHPAPAAGGAAGGHHGTAVKCCGASIEAEKNCSMGCCRAAAKELKICKPCHQ